ncbi:MAG: outer membrane protein assembly factor [Flavobacteriaceae bacterium]|jgi:outer membrane protein assembly factor BamA|nr:outer membrane protein assembly factor [Flavobacteriaceae bacterium]
MGYSRNYKFITQSGYSKKYIIFFSSAILLALLNACSTTRKVPNGEFLLTKNEFQYEGEKVLADRIPDYVSQKPNKKQLFIVPFGLWSYNAVNPKYDSILNEYMSNPKEIRNQKLRDSIYIKFGHPEYVGKTLLHNRLKRSLGKPPVIWDEGKTDAGANAIRRILVYKGYWDADVTYKSIKDSAAKKAKVNYLINAKDPTYINGYSYNIPDSGVKSVYENSLNKSLVKDKKILDQEILEDETKRINALMKDNGYYNFNASGEYIYFTADTLNSKKQVPLTLEIHKDSLDSSPFRKTTIGKIKVFYLRRASDAAKAENDTAIAKLHDTLGISIYKFKENYKTLALWRPIPLKTGDIYEQQYLDLAKRNLTLMNNFNVSEQLSLNKENDSILDVSYYLTPLRRYDLRLTADYNYSEILNHAVAPSIDLTTRNLFGGAENLTTSLSLTYGTIQNPKNPDKKIGAFEFSLQETLTFPKLLLPFKYYKFIPKRYSPTSNINLGASIQQNIGLGRIGFNGSLNYLLNIQNELISHRLSILNTEFSLTRNKDKYYDFFTGERDVVNQLHEAYFQEHPEIELQFNNGNINFDDVSASILNDANFINDFSNSNAGNRDLYFSFVQSITNKDRQTQDVLISSIIYNFKYNQIGRKNFKNPFGIDITFETAGNIFSLVKSAETQDGVALGTAKTIFGIPYSQFVKLDVNLRKYFTFFNDKHTLALRQFIGVGIPYGNSENMPFIRSYYTGGPNDIRAWRVFGGLGPADVQVNEKVRAYIMDNLKLTTNIEYRVPFNEMFEGAAFVDAGNIWNLKDSGFGDQFKFSKFISQMGVGTGFGLRVNVAYIKLRLDFAYKVHDPNMPPGDRWVISKWKPFKPVMNIAFGYPF